MGIPEERIERLEALASEAASEGEHERAREYVRLARRVAERNRVRPPRTFRRFACDACDAYLRPGANARVRLRDGHVAVRCDHCGTIERHPYDS